MFGPVTVNSFGDIQSLFLSLRVTVVVIVAEIGSSRVTYVIRLRVALDKEWVEAAQTRDNQLVKNLTL